MAGPTLRENRYGQEPRNPLDRANLPKRRDHGETWIIGRRPHDPENPGPFGTSGWRPDGRTGRHRRDELPDPLPPRRTGPDEEAVQRPSPRRSPDQGRDGGGHRFAPLREAAMDRFMRYSAELHAAHFQPERPYFRERVARLARWCLWALALGLVAGPEPVRVRPPVPVPAPRTAGHASVPRPDSPMASAIGGAQAARKAIADRAKRDHADLAAAVRAGAGHWRGTPRQERPAPYMSAWEQAFDAAPMIGFGGAA